MKAQTTGAATAAIAVIGIATRLPEAADLATLRANLRAGRDSVRPIPPERVASTGLDASLDYPDMGYVDRIDLFDHELFGLSRYEAEVTDPQHRLALHLTQEALENAGYTPAALRDSRTAVVFSSPGNGYLPFVSEPGTLSLMGNMPFALPARISHLFALTGPCYGVDTGCNGSLVAVHQGCRELRDGEADYAVVGGVSLRHFIAPAAAADDFPGIASPTARSRAFDEAADGAGAGEGGAVLLLTTLERALDEGAFVHAVIRGTATAHNGRHSATIATPSARAQADVIARAWDRAGLDIGTAGYLEAHGSGTRLGDAVEVEGLALARQGKRRPLAIGSLKTNLGHLDHAAGIAGLVKAILSVRHAELYPSLHFRQAAAEVDLIGAELEVVTSLRPWRTEGVRRAGVSSFSLGGVNAHCVVEEPPALPAASPSDGAPRVVGVSGRTEADLYALCERLSVELRTSPLPFEDIARTLNTGREHHPFRVGVVADGTRHLATGLAAAVTWGRLDPVSEPPARPRVVLLLSGDARPPAATGAPAPLPETLRLPAAHADAVRGQLAAHAAFVRAGIAPHGLISSGFSRYAVRHLSGTLTDEDIRDLASGDVTVSPVDPDRLRAAADEQLALGPVVFVELGSSGELSDLLADHLAGRPGAHVLTAGPGTDGVLGALARLYELGHDPDWAALSPAGRRVPLPGPPFRGVPCWARRAGEMFTAPTATPPDTAVTPRAPAVRKPAEQVPVPAPILPAESADAAPAPVPAVAEPPAVLQPRTAATAPEPSATATAPEPSDGPDSAAEVLPWLRETLAELLYAETVAPDDDYFAIGGNSIIALLLLKRVEQRYGVSLRMIDVYDHPAVADLASAVQADLTPSSAPDPSPGPQRAAPGEDTTALPPIRRTDALVLSYGQERMWFHHQLDPGTTLYNLPGASRHSGPIDPEAMRLAWEDLAERHEVLRSNFVSVDGRARLAVRPELGDFFRYEDLTGRTDAERTAREIIRVESERSLDVERDPLVRVTLIRLAPDDHLFCWLTHHAVNDGWAPQILMRELMEFYQARCEGREHRSEPLPVQYRDYAHWQRELMEHGLLDGQLRYWKERLTDPPVLQLPTDRPRAARMDFAGAAHGLTIPPELVDRLRKVGVEESATLFTLLLTGLTMTLSRWADQRDIVVGTPTIGRTRPELWGLLGFFNNTIALRSDLSGDPDFRTLLRQVRTGVIDGLENQEIPFDAVVREVAPERGPARNPIFDVMYVHQTLPPHFVFGESLFGPAVDEEGGPLFPGLPPGTSKFDISVVVGERAGADDLDVVVEYSTHLFDRGTIAAITGSWVDLLWAATGDTGLPLSALPGRPAGQETDAGAGLRPFELPTDRPRPQGGGNGTTARHEVPLPDSLAPALDDAGLLAVLVTLLTERAESDELVLGLVRPHTAPLPLRIDVTDEPSLTELTGRIARLYAEAEAGPLPGAPLPFDITADLRGAGGAADGPAPDLHWIVADHWIAVDYRTELFDEATVLALADDFVTLARAAAASAE
ncbi:condensation domain-containing protein [Streptomyces sp. IB2014 016-6]|uniref:condensation domain-containing protein n=1 Tax=Streptomyces sp. IB2014 016-6 TaxID=2517818 RepID=UPI0011C8AD38|nr:condensation domain-containing protein [Streptomyces sp. IB2014 016-6]TXL89770.1 polyketide synthase [Streptomyces sp. IB2014 016-6]